MACRGVYFALNPDEEQRLLSCSSDDEVRAAIEQIEESWDAEHLQETDKAWDAMHRCLGNGTLKPQSKTSLARVVLGGKRLYSDDDYIVSYLTAPEVRELARELLPISEQWFRERYFALKKKRIFFFGDSDYAPFVSEEDFGYTWAYFDDVRTFFQKAAAENRPIIFTVDQ
jgi:hypothetical protein